MHILVLTPEYPPNIVGGLGQHVAELTEALVAKGATVTVLTPLRPPDGGREREEQEGLSVRRVRDHAPAPSDSAKRSSSVMSRSCRLPWKWSQKVVASTSFTPTTG